MNKNVGKKDKHIRIAVAVVLFPLLFFKTSPLRWLGLLSFPLLATAMTQRCGAYALTGINTSEAE